MKRFALLLLLLSVMLSPLLAVAGAREDYVTQFPLTLGRDGDGAYRVVLDERVYRQVQSPALADLDVINRDGRTVPAALFAPEQPLAKPAPRLPLPWYALPAAPASTANGWQLHSEADADGRLRRVDVRVTDPGAAPLPRTALLLDLSRVREAVAALHLQWQPVTELDVGMRVEASDDLENWQPLATRGRLVDLTRETQRLLQRRIDLYGVLPHYQRARYLRLTPDRADVAFEITSVEAELASAAAAPAPLWQQRDGQRGQDGARHTFEYDLGGRFPVQQVDVALDGNHAGEWRLESRDSHDADWRPRVAPWVAFAIDGGNAGGRSAPRVLSGTVRDRYWRLSTDTDVAATPRLRLGYRPEVMVFVAQGPGPYALVAGSVRARRAEAPVPQLVDAVRKQRGEAWQPTTAYLGEPATLAGTAVLASQRDWKAWLLWGVLALGALVVAVFALTLMRVASHGRDDAGIDEADEPASESSAEAASDEDKAPAAS